MYHTDEKVMAEEGAEEALAVAAMAVGERAMVGGATVAPLAEAAGSAVSQEVALAGKSGVEVTGAAAMAVGWAACEVAVKVA